MKITLILYVYAIFAFFMNLLFELPSWLSLLLYQVALDRYNKMKGSAPERLVSGSDDFTMFLWEPAASKHPKTRMTGHQQVWGLVSISLVFVAMYNHCSFCVWRETNSLHCFSQLRFSYYEVWYLVDERLKQESLSYSIPDFRMSAVACKSCLLFSWWAMDCKCLLRQISQIMEWNHRKICGSLPWSCWACLSNKVRFVYIHIYICSLKGCSSNQHVLLTAGQQTVGCFWVEAKTQH